MSRKKRKRSGEIAAALAGLLTGGLQGYLSQSNKMEDRDLRKSLADRENALAERKIKTDEAAEQRLQSQSESTIELNRAKTQAAGKGGIKPTAAQKAKLFGVLSEAGWDPLSGQQGATSMLQKALKGLETEKQGPTDFLQALLQGQDATEKGKKRTRLQGGLDVASGFPELFGETGQAPAPQPGGSGMAAADQQAHGSLLNAYGTLFTSNDPVAPQMDILWQQLSQVLGPSVVPERVRARMQGVGPTGLPNTMQQPGLKSPGRGVR